MPHQLTLPLLHELTLAALEDSVGDVALDHPGVAPTLRWGRSRRERVADLNLILHKLEGDKRFQQLAALETMWKDIDHLSSVQDFPQLWTKFVATLDELDFYQQKPGPDPLPVFTMKALSNGRAIDLELAASSVRTAPQADDPASFVAAVTGMCQAYRRTEFVRFAPADRLALLRAYQLVEAGVRPAPPMSALQTDLTRPVPTYLALADPGQSHLRHTVRRSDLLQGTIVHVETIDRGGIADRGIIEAYRIPSIRDVARIRVHVGDETPCSVYVGRPVYEGWSIRDAALQGEELRRAFDQSLLKAIHTVAAACSGLFALGVAECKIGLDGLSSKQAIATMKGLVGNVIRDRARQRLSAAFNINTPLRDDRGSNNQSVDVKDRFAIARMAIELAKQGGFDKIAWDGASDGASTPFVEQLPHAQILELIHVAHSRGLETYVSAGMTAEHLLPATLLGVGGVGIGIRLHAKNSSGDITHLLPEQVREVLVTRDSALSEPAGRAAASLAQLDWLHAKALLEPEQEDLRDALFNALLAYHQAPSPAAQVILKSTLQKSLVPVEHFLTEQRERTKVPTRGGAHEQSDPIFDIARGQIRHLSQVTDQPEAARLNEAQRLNEMIEEGDSEGLKYFLGYR